MYHNFFSMLQSESSFLSANENLRPIHKVLFAIKISFCFKWDVQGLVMVLQSYPVNSYSESSTTWLVHTARNRDLDRDRERDWKIWISILCRSVHTAWDWDRDRDQEREIWQCILYPFFRSWSWSRSCFPCPGPGPNTQ